MSKKQSNDSRDLSRQHETRGAVKYQSEEGEGQKITIADFVIPEKVDAFCQQYKPEQDFHLDGIAFTDAKLREFFKAYVCPYGDPLRWYVWELQNRGYNMVAGILDEPAIYVSFK